MGVGLVDVEMSYEKFVQATSLGSNRNNIYKDRGYVTIMVEPGRHYGYSKHSDNETSEHFMFAYLCDDVIKTVSVPTLYHITFTVDNRDSFMIN
jgi:superfamily II helicase